MTLWAVTFGTARRRLGGAATRPVSSSLAEQITVLLYSRPLLCGFIVPIACGYVGLSLKTWCPETNIW